MYPNGIAHQSPGLRAALPRVEQPHTTLPRRGCVRWRRVARALPTPLRNPIGVECNAMLDEPRVATALQP